VGIPRFVVRNFEELLAGTLMVLMSLVTVANVFARYFFNAPFEWAEEFARYTFIWLVFVGAVVATKQKKHILIDAVLIVVPPTAKRVMAVVADVLTMVLMLLLIYYGWRLMAFTIQPTATLKIPQYWIYLSLPFSATLIILHSLADLRRNIAALLNGDGRP
jgi:TRAP-type C4-dicarboxylate transport system permease small subunit